MIGHPFRLWPGAWIRPLVIRPTPGILWPGRAVCWRAEARVPQGDRGRFLFGLATLLAGSGLGLTVGAIVEGVAHGLPWEWAVVEAMALKLALATCGLDRAAGQVEAALAAGDLPEARRLLGWHLVSRPTGELNPEEVAAAAVESVAENLTDAFVAPLAAWLAGGLPAVWAYRFVQTSDSMWGYHDPDHEWLERAARLDDALNWLPSRLAAAILALAAGIVRGGCEARLAHTRRPGRPVRPAPTRAKPWRPWLACCTSPSPSVARYFGRRPGAGHCRDAATGPAHHAHCCRPVCGPGLRGAPGSRKAGAVVPEMPAPRPEVAALAGDVDGGPDYAELAGLGAGRGRCTRLQCQHQRIRPAARRHAGPGRLRPDSLSRSRRMPLSTALAQYEGTGPGEILCANGAVQLIWSIAMAYVRPGADVLIAGPTFGEYRVASQIMGGVVTEWRAGVDYAFMVELDALAGSWPGCSPGGLAVQPEQPYRQLSRPGRDGRTAAGWRRGPSG